MAVRIFAGLFAASGWPGAEIPCAVLGGGLPKWQPAHAPVGGRTFVLYKMEPAATDWARAFGTAASTNITTAIHAANACHAMLREERLADCMVTSSADEIEIELNGTRCE